MTDNHADVILVGGGQAAVQAVASLRQFGFAGTIKLICEEPYLPYQRPPLSKAYLQGDMTRERLYFRPDTWYTDHDIDVTLSSRVTKLDAAAQQITMSEGKNLTYGRAILATGSRPRTLPIKGADLDGVHYLRGIADIDALKPRMTTGQKLAIIGAGYIGLEAAAVARKRGVDVTVIEMADRILARVTSPAMSTYFQTLHKTHGVAFKTMHTTTEILGQSGQVSGLVLGTRETIEADTVLVGIGVLPNIELAKEAGIDCDNGIIVDTDGRTSDANIYAAGDCTHRPIFPYGTQGRLESVHNAIEQGKAVAAAISGKPHPKIDCPWFWSDQYDVKLQIAGLSTGYDQAILRGNTQTHKFAVYYLKDGVHIATDAVNSAPDFLMSKRMILAQVRPDPIALADMSVTIQDIAKPLL